MKKSSRLKKYVELFARGMENYLAPGINLNTTVYPVEGEGAVFEFILSKENGSKLKMSKTRRSVGAVLSEIPQRLVAGNIENVNFKGTNLYLEGNRILLIKGEDSSNEWSGNAVKQDLMRVISTSQGSRQHD